MPSPVHTTPCWCTPSPWHQGQQAWGCLLRSRDKVVTWLGCRAQPVTLGHCCSAHPGLVAPKATVQSMEMEASGWFVPTVGMAVLSGGLLGGKRRGSRQGGGTTVPMLRAHSLDVSAAPPDCSLGRLRGHSMQGADLGWSCPSHCTHPCSLLFACRAAREAWTSSSQW